MTSPRTVEFPAVFPRLVTERLVLRALEPRDADAVWEMHSTPETMRYMNTTPWTGRERAQTYVERARAGFAAREFVRWALTRREDDLMLGTVNLFALDPQCRRAEIGYLLAHAAWGRGYMREALGPVIAWGFERLGLNRLEADTDPRNTASVRALEHFGFVREGLRRERWIVGGEVSDTLDLGLLAKDWEAREARS